MKEANCPNNILPSIFSQREKVELTGERKCQVHNRCPTNNTLFWKYLWLGKINIMRALWYIESKGTEPQATLKRIC